MSVPVSHAQLCALPGTPLADVRAGIDACVHCGFCLQACPTYLVLEDENDSPRGRIMLMRLVSEGELPADDPGVHAHISRCLGCRGCETVCPSGVPYGQLLEATRATLWPRHSLPLAARVILAVFERPAVLRLAMALSRALRATGLPKLLARLPGRMGFAFAMLHATRRAVKARRYTPRGNGTRGSAALLDGCVMRGLYGETNNATARVLTVNNYRVVRAPGQRCCGALHAHAGDLEGARALARANIQAFERSGADVIVVNSAGCGAMCKEYGHLLAHDPDWAERAAAVASRVRDVSEVLAEAGPAPAVGAALTVAYDAPCHLIHAQRVNSAPLSVLEMVKGIQMVPLVEADQCCGSAGIFTLLEPEVSGQVLSRKLAHIAECGADVVATGNPGCLMQIGAGMLRAGVSARAVHPVDLLDAAYASDAERDR